MSFLYNQSPLMHLRFAHPLGVVCCLLTLSLFCHALDANATANATILLRTSILPGRAVKPGTKLRILCAGDSITSGWLSDVDGGDGNGYRLQLRDDLSKDDVVFAGTVSAGSMTDGYFAAWPGKTVKYISDHVGPSLKQRPNIILLHAGTNDMDDRPLLSTEGNEPADVAERLGDLVDQMIEACPDAVILVAIIIGSCDPRKSTRTPEYQAAIPGVVEKRRSAGHHVLTVNFTTFSESDLQDCIHPTIDGYHELGHYWYDFITQIPSDWIQDPVGVDPTREKLGDEDSEASRIQWPHMILLQACAWAIKTYLL